ncbi:hypothetical protein H4R19_002074 [Coemansia spiralis]|nr:hypothetical protein H4R19_002074 [Coemansia spiralis]
MFTGSDGGDIVFPELTCLAVKYGYARVGSDQQLPKLRFPKLRMASVHCYKDDMPLLRQAVFPMQMTSFEIVAPAALFTLLEGVEMPRVERLKVNLGGSVLNPDAVAAANRFMHRVRGCQHKELIIHTDCTVVPPELITCTDLTSLTLRATVDISIAPLGAHERVGPLNTSLQSLVLCTDAMDDENYMVAVAKYLLMRLPRLAYFPIGDIPRAPLIAFAREYAHIYPHLASAANVLVDG